MAHDGGSVIGLRGASDGESEWHRRCWEAGFDSTEDWTNCAHVMNKAVFRRMLLEPHHRVELDREALVQEYAWLMDLRPDKGFKPIPGDRGSSRKMNIAGNGRIAFRVAHRWAQRESARAAVPMIGIEGVDVEDHRAISPLDALIASEDAEARKGVWEAVAALEPEPRFFVEVWLFTDFSIPELASLVQSLGYEVATDDVRRTFDKARRDIRRFLLHKHPKWFGS